MGLFCHIQDSIRMAPGAVEPYADSLPRYGTEDITEIIPQAGFPADSTYITVPTPDPAAHIFGETSYADMPTEILSLRNHSFTSDIPYQLAVLAVLVFFLYVMMRYRDEALQLLRLMFGRKREGRSADDQQSVLSAFVNYMAVILIMGAGIAVTRGFDLWTGGEQYGVTGILPDAFISFPLLITIVAMLAICIITGLQWLILKASGSITFSEVFVNKLLWQKRIFMATLAVATAPLAIVMALASPRWVLWLGCAAFVIALIMILWFAVRTLKLFMGQKVSILFWFLYLCAVEIMPYGIIAAATLRGVAI